MTPQEIKAALKEVGGWANKDLGQHFLTDRTVLDAIMDAASVRPGDFVLEVGPGFGALTQALLDAGAEVVAIERDRRFVNYLNPRLSPRRGMTVRVVQGDAATIHWHEIVGDHPWKFISNLPYAITSLALRKALWAPKPPENLVVLVQREVAERATSVAIDVARRRKGGKTSLLSLMVALASSSVRIVRRVPPDSFFPAPSVESAVLHIVPLTAQERQKRWGMDPERIMQVAKLGFAHPRKMIASNLKLYASSLAEVGIPGTARAEDLSPDDWARLTRSVHGVN
jgi:16S rRNA (adenine1518-N6/adenine1519-N6)-dimethyltransferase